MAYKLIAMDLDGTLTQHKSKLTATQRAVLDRLRTRYYLVMVGAGGCARIYAQMEEYPIDIIGNYGMQYAEVKDGAFTLLRDECVPVDQDDISARVTALRERFALYPIVGDNVEFHASGLVTFPVLGTKAALKDKLAYDPNREKRRRMYEVVRDAFPEYTVFIGGSSSFDIAPKPYDKLYALRTYAAVRGIDVSEIVYFGDDYGLGGNDEAVYRSEIRFVPVADYRCFSEVVQEFLL